MPACASEDPITVRASGITVFPNIQQHRARDRGEDFEPPDHWGGATSPMNVPERAANRASRQQARVEENGGTFLDQLGGWFSRGLTGDVTDIYAEKKSMYLNFQFVPMPGHQVSFKAFITEFSDNYESNWNDEEVYGRMDPISTFQGTRRTINFSFDVVAEGLAAARENQYKSSQLVSMLYPVYEQISSGDFSASTITAAPLIKIRFANLIQDFSKGGSFGGLVGKLSGISYQPDMEAGFFDPDSNELYPKINRFSCTFTVLHMHPMGYNVDDGFRWGSKGYPYGDLQYHAEQDAADGGLPNQPPPVAPDSGGIRFPWSDDDSNEAVPAPESQVRQEEQEVGEDVLLGTDPLTGFGIRGIREH